MSKIADKDKLTNQKNASNNKDESTTISFRRLYIAVKADNEKHKVKIKELANKLHNAEQSYLEESQYHTQFKKLYQLQCLESLQLKNMCDKYEKYLRIERTALFALSVASAVFYRNEVIDCLCNLF